MGTNNGAKIQRITIEIMHTTVAFTINAPTEITSNGYVMASEIKVKLPEITAGINKYIYGGIGKLNASNTE